MCGIAGILTFDQGIDLRSISDAMLRTLEHRGPDDFGSQELALPSGGRLLLVHTRLSILDLSRAGHQPMQDPASDSWIVYNGEIYNHQQLRAELPQCEFRSNCDTETLLKAWAERGPASLESLRGMFAFALYDGRRRELHLVRDRMGIKPLYVCQVSSKTLLFASEVRTLLQSGLVARRLNSEAIRSYLAFGAVSAPWTLVQGVQSLLPGERLQLDLSTDTIAPRSTRYWLPTFTRQKNSMGYDEAIERIRPVLLESLSLHMMADVPVGVFLSGGIDSSAIVAGLTHLGHRVRTFSIWFGEEAFDESVHARTVATRFGTEHVELYTSPKKVFADLDTALAAYDQPSIDGLNSFFISQAVHRAGIKVAMSGLGGDELFAGYSTFRMASLMDRQLNRRLVQAVYPALTRYAPGTMRAKKLRAILAANGSRLKTYSVFRQVMLPARRAELLQAFQDDEPPLPAQIIDELTAAIGPLDPPNAYSLLELSLYLANMLLRDTDQMSMAHSLEVRVPILDHRLIEAVASVPGFLKLAGLRRASKKRLLIDALPVPLPREVFNRRKMGFVFPWELWLRNELRQVIGCVFNDWEALEAVGLAQHAVQDLWSRFQRNQPGVRYTDILSLVHLLTWVRANKMSQ